MYLTSKTLTYNALSVHHIVPLSEDPSRALDPTNLITLCPLHHELAEDGTISRAELSQIAQEQQERTQ